MQISKPIPIIRSKVGAFGLKRGNFVSIFSSQIYRRRLFQWFRTVPCLFVALLDLLPAVGVGTVMGRWALICFLSGRPGLGAGLLVAFVIITVMREISESHIIGSQLGIPAVVTLLSVYVGLRTAGILGMLIGPFAALLIKNIATFYISFIEKEKQTG